MAAPQKRCVVLLYPQNEETEIVCPVTVLRRGGIDVKLAGPTMEPVVGSRGMRIVPELTLKDAIKQGPWDCVLLAGGQHGWRSLTDDPDVGKILRDQEKAGRLVAAICTSPIAMKNHGVMTGRRLTSYPTVEDRVREGDKFVYKYDDVVKDGNLISSRGHYTSFHFGLAVLEYLTNRRNAEEAGREMLIVY